MVRAEDMIKKGLGRLVTSTAKSGKHWSNGYTGKKITGMAAPLVLGGAVLAAGGLGTGTDNPKNGKDITALNAMSLVRKPEVPLGENTMNPVMLADGTAGNIPSTGNAPTLGTDGSMVFGMHNKKQGGYL